MSDQDGADYLAGHRRGYEPRRRFISLALHRTTQQKPRATRTRRPHQTEHANNERALVQSATRTTIATVIIAAAGVLTLVAAIVQAVIFDGQLDEMRSAGKQTDKVIAATQGQLAAMEDDQRAWVKVESVAPFVGGVMAMSGLRFVRPGFPANLPLHLVLKNVGRSPAFKVMARVWPQLGDLPRGPLKDQETACASLGNMYPDAPMAAMNTDIIPVLFPDDPTPYDTSLSISPAQLETVAGDQKTFGFWFYGCVYYRLAGSTMPHQTGFAYWVTRLVDVQMPSGQAGKAQAGFTVGEDVPPDRIMFNPMPMAAGPTN
jgi:hypothetical protein